MIKVMSPNFRVSFPQVFQAKAMPGATKAKYGLVALFTLAEIAKDPEQVKLWKGMQAAAEQAVNEKWPDLKTRPKILANPFRKGEEKEQFSGYGPGVIFVSLTTMTKPGVADASVKPIIAPEEFYAGCYARATVNPYAWSFAGRNGVSFGLQNVQKIKDGEPFGNRTKPEDDFDAAAGSGAVAEDVMGSLFGTGADNLV